RPTGTRPDPSAGRRTDQRATATNERATGGYARAMRTNDRAMRTNERAMRTDERTMRSYDRAMRTDERTPMRTDERRVESVRVRDDDPVGEVRMGEEDRTMHERVVEEERIRPPERTEAQHEAQGERCPRTTPRRVRRVRRIRVVRIPVGGITIAWILIRVVVARSLVAITGRITRSCSTLEGRALGHDAAAGSELPRDVELGHRVSARQGGRQWIVEV